MRFVFARLAPEFLLVSKEGYGMGVVRFAREERVCGSCLLVLHQSFCCTRVSAGVERRIRHGCRAARMPPGQGEVLLAGQYGVMDLLVWASRACGPAAWALSSTSAGGGVIGGPLILPQV